MPVTCVLSPETDRIPTRCTGCVTFRDVLDHFQTLAADPALPPRPEGPVAAA